MLAATTPTIVPPASLLLNRELDNGWTVIKRFERSNTATGSCFSTGYVVKHKDGRQAFMKAMDYTRALLHPAGPAMMQYLLEAYRFEKEICEKCKASHLSRVVHAIDSGFLILNEGDGYSRVDYLIFDLADGDIRAHIDQSDIFDSAFAMRAIHNVAAALQQLHRADIAHQDLKPSNVLVYKLPGVQQTRKSKLTDFGRAWSGDLKAPHDAAIFAGDPKYIPFELMYNEKPQNEKTYRFGTDLFLLGSLIMYLFSRVYVSSAVIDRLEVQHRPGTFRDPYPDVIPYLENAFGAVLTEFAQSVPEPVRQELVEVVGQLCNPRPEKRGHPDHVEGRSNAFSLERYISLFDLLAVRLEYKLTRTSK